MYQLITGLQITLTTGAAGGVVWIISHTKNESLFALRPVQILEPTNCLLSIDTRSLMAVNPVLPVPPLKRPIEWAHLMWAGWSVRTEKAPIAVSRIFLIIIIISDIVGGMLMVLCLHVALMVVVIGWVYTAMQNNGSIDTVLFPLRFYHVFGCFCVNRSIKQAQKLRIASVLLLCKHSLRYIESCRCETF